MVSVRKGVSEEVVREFVALSKVEWGYGDPLEGRVRELMCELRRGGFLSREVSELSGGRWSMSTVRDYSSGWGGVADSSEKVGLMGVLRGLASSGCSVEDVSRFLTMERSVRAKGSSFEDVAELDSVLRASGSDPEVLLRMSRELIAWRLSVKQVRERIDFESEMISKLGIGYPDVALVASMCRDYGGLQGVKERIDLYKRIVDMRRILRSQAEVRDRAQRDVAAAMDKYNEYKAANESLLFLANMGWKTMVLATLPSLLRQSDSPEKFQMVLNGIDSIEQMRAEEETLSRRIKASKEEVAHDVKLRAMIKALEGNPVVKNVIEIITNPGAVTLSPEDKAGYLYHILKNYDLMIRGDDRTPPELVHNWEEILKHLEKLEPYAAKLTQKIEAQRQ